MTTQLETSAAPDGASLRIPRMRTAGAADADTRGERRDAAENRRLVLATARALFDARGVEAVNMHDIAQAAGIGQGTLYRRYPHKGALCHALLQENLQRFHDTLVARLEAAPDGTPALAQLREFLDALLAFYDDNGPLASAMGDSGCGVSSEEHYRHPWIVWQQETLATLLEKAVAGREIAPLDVEATVDVVQAACEPALYLHQRGRGYSRERIAATLMRLLGQR